MKRFIAITLLILSTTLPLQAGEKDLTPAAMAEISMAEKLFALGQARREPMMILAAIRLRATLGGETSAPGKAFTSQEEAFAAARKIAKGDDAMMSIIDDVEANSSRRMCIYARNGVCY